MRAQVGGGVKFNAYFRVYKDGCGGTIIDAGYEVVATCTIGCFSVQVPVSSNSFKAIYKCVEVKTLTPTPDPTMTSIPSAKSTEAPAPKSTEGPAPKSTPAPTKNSNGGSDPHFRMWDGK